MMLSCSSIYTTATTSFFPLPSQSKKQQLLLHNNPFSLRKPKPSSSCSSVVCFITGVQEIAELAQNKVLIAATVSAVIGQLSKPFASALLYGDDVDFKDLARAGGFPSVHSSSVVAAATSLGLERGFSDSVFGMAVVFASIVMYDAQGVRWEVGKHAKVLNRIQMLKSRTNSIPNNNKDDGLGDSNSRTSSINSESVVPVLSTSENESSYKPKSTNSTFQATSNTLRSTLSSTTPNNDSVVIQAEDSERSSIWLKESIGHTEVEVIAGAVLGFLVSLAVHTTFAR